MPANGATITRIIDCKTAMVAPPKTLPTATAQRGTGATSTSFSGRGPSMPLFRAMERALPVRAPRRPSRQASNSTADEAGGRCQAHSLTVSASALHRPNSTLIHWSFGTRRRTRG